MIDVEFLHKVSQSKELQDIEWMNCQQDPYYYLTTWAFTLDVHDKEDTIKPFPKSAHLKLLVDTWMEDRLMFVPKSRQMMMSWLFTSLYGWDTQFNPGRLTFFQSKKAEDADDLVKRAKFVYDHQPKFLKRYMEGGVFKDLHVNPQHSGQHTQGKMTFPEINSEIRGIPEGGDVIRMHTASGILSDEMAFQPEAKPAYTAAKPTISSKGRFTAVSTAEDNTFFEDMCFDNIETI